MFFFIEITVHKKLPRLSSLKNADNAMQNQAWFKLIQSKK